MEVRLLGPVEAYANGKRIDLGARRPRFVLGVLALEVNQPVPLDRLVVLNWPVSPPRTASHAVVVSISQLRRVLSAAGAEAELVRRGTGYMLRADPRRIDAHCFRALVDRARDAPDEQKIKLLDEALELWTGPPLDGCAPPEVRDRLCRSLDEARLATIEDRLDAKLRLGLHPELLLELPQLAADHPLRERLIAQLMLALHRSGRSGEALAIYRETRARLVAELGLDPSRELQSMERAILRDDSAIAVTPASVLSGSSVPVPAQLPPVVAGFAGRHSQLEWLDSAATVGLTGAEAPGVIMAIAGTAGVGKTTLAVRWAHSVAERFPDGLLYVNLRGFDPSRAAMTPSDAVRGFLDALGVPRERVPVELDAQTARYRSLVAGRRMLVVLDNARDAQQIRPLLPGTGSVLVLVTSRNQLSSLVAVEGARTLTLDLLSPAEARELLEHRLGAVRLAAEPDPVNQIVAHCAGLPLALAIVAARAMTHPRFPLHAFADELRAGNARLDRLTGEDAATDVRAVFSWSYHALSPLAASLFRLIGLHPGPDIGAAAAASLAGLAPQRVRPLLDELSQAHLVVEHAPERYALHDLLRAYATELAHSQDPDERRRAAVVRMLDHYLQSAHAADRTWIPTRDPITLMPGGPGVTPEQVADLGAAMAWFDAEHAVLLAMIDHAAGAGFDTHTWQLAWALTTFLERRGHWLDHVEMQQAALKAAERAGDLIAQGRACRYLARAYYLLGRDVNAEAHLRQALDLHGRAHDPAGQAHAHYNLAHGAGRQGRQRDGLDHARQALDLYRAADNLAGQADALNGIGWFLLELNEPEEAYPYCQAALALSRKLGDRGGQAATLDSIGLIRHQLGQYAEALSAYEEALSLYRDLGDRYWEATVLSRTGDTQQALGQLEAATRAWQQAVDILELLQHPNAALLRAKVDAMR